MRGRGNPSEWWRMTKLLRRASTWAALLVGFRGKRWWSRERRKGSVSRSSAGADRGTGDPACLEAAWRTEPSRIDLACALYDRLMEQQRGVEAAAVMREVVARFPHSIIGNFLLGERLLATDQPSEAARCFQSSADAQPTQANEWLYRSLSLIRLRRAEEAEIPLRHFLTLQPGHVHGILLLIQVLIDRDHAAEAASLLGQAIESAPA
jgi:tetratricopeptide (TPR) repeat protein